MIIIILKILALQNNEEITMTMNRKVHDLDQTCAQVGTQLNLNAWRLESNLSYLLQGGFLLLL